MDDVSYSKTTHKTAVNNFCQESNGKRPVVEAGRWENHNTNFFLVLVFFWYFGILVFSGGSGGSRHFSGGIFGDFRRIFPETALSQKNESVFFESGD